MRTKSTSDSLEKCEMHQGSWPLSSFLLCNGDILHPALQGSKLLEKVQSSREFKGTGGTWMQPH